MCKSQAEGGQRCAAHTRDGFHAAEAAVHQAHLGGDPVHIARATQQWDTAAAEYASTPTGRADLDQRRADYEQADSHEAAAMLAAVIRRGDALREANTAAAHAIRQHRPAPQQPTGAEMAATNDDEALAADFMDWQGDGPEPASPYDEEGWLLDDNGQQWGYCNACGDERQPHEDCCEDGEIVPAAE